MNARERVRKLERAMHGVECIRFFLMGMDVAEGIDLFPDVQDRVDEVVDVLRDLHTDACRRLSLEGLVGGGDGDE